MFPTDPAAVLAALRASSRRLSEQVNTDDTWFTDDTCKFVPREELFAKANTEHENFSALDRRFGFKSTCNDELSKWLQESSDAAMLSRLAETPSRLDDKDGEPPYTFSPFQRLAMSYATSCPFNHTASARLDAEGIRDMGVYNDDDRVRTRPIESRCTKTEGPNSFLLFDLPTATGKTAISIGTMLMLLTGQWRIFKAQEHSRSHGQIVQGGGSTLLPRLGMLVPTGTTHDHFLKTVKRMLPVFEEMYPHLVFKVWTGATWSPMDACKEGENVVIIGLAVDSTAMLRKAPECSVPYIVYDEYNVKPPKEKWPTCKSNVLRWAILQATPHNLVSATTGCSNPLKDFFKGELSKPSSAKCQVMQRRFNDAQKSLDQACLMACVSLSVFRPFLQKDLSMLLPTGIISVLIRCKRLSIGSLLGNSQQDMYPANLQNVLLKMVIGNVFPSNESIQRFRAVFEGTVTTKTIIDALGMLEPTDQYTKQSLEAVMSRTIKRMEEFSMECPICVAPGSLDDASLCAHCGYCFCKTCQEQIRSAECPFCRTPMPTHMDMSIMPPLPPRAVPMPDIDRSLPLEENIKRATSPKASQNSNLRAVIKVLYEMGVKRPIVLFEPPSFNDRRIGQLINVDEFTKDTEYKISFVSGMSGQGKKFAKQKQEFDDNPNCGLASTTNCQEFVIGTDLAKAGCIIAIGRVPPELITQALARAFRPNAERDNKMPLPVIRLTADVERRTTGEANRNVRQRIE